jgi:hypothetical protein
MDNGWQPRFEAFCVCGHCAKSTVYVLGVKSQRDASQLQQPGTLVNFKNSVNSLYHVLGHVSTKDVVTTIPPEHLPEDVLAAFNEGAQCLAIGCHNAAGTMFRLCVDLASRNKLPAEDANGLNRKVRRDLGLRLPWLFDNGLLPADLREISTCIKEDGNDGAHQGTLTEAEALDLLDFSVTLLERIYTDPEKLRIAKERRDARRAAA